MSTQARIGDGPTVVDLCRTVAQLEAQLGQAARGLGLLGLVRCASCGEWDKEPTWKFLGAVRCFGCYVTMLEAMIQTNGPEWGPFYDLTVRPAALADLAEACLGLPKLTARANDAFEAVGEADLLLGWAAAPRTGPIFGLSFPLTPVRTSAILCT